jgi:excisionase family DNA binding protein
MPSRIRRVAQGCDDCDEFPDHSRPPRDDTSTTSRPRGLLSIDDVAEYLGVSQRWVYEQVRTGRLPAMLIARSWRLRQDVVDAFADTFLWHPHYGRVDIGAADSRLTG